MKILEECIVTGSRQKSPQKYTLDQSAILQRISQPQRECGNLDAFGTALERTQRHTKELSRIGVDTAKAIENTARETAEFSAEKQKEVYR